MAVTLTIELLGPFAARVSGRPPLRLPKKTQALLTYLALAPNRARDRSEIAALLWSDTNDAQAKASLRVALSELRKSLGRAAAVLEVDASRVALDVVAVDVDVLAFRRRVAERTPPALAEAAALYRGDLLKGFDLDEAPFEEWLLAERERAREE